MNSRQRNTAFLDNAAAAENARIEKKTLELLLHGALTRVVPQLQKLVLHADPQVRTITLCDGDHPERRIILHKEAILSLHRILQGLESEIST